MTESIKIKSILITVMITLMAFATSATVRIGEFSYEFNDTNQTATVTKSHNKANPPHLIPEKVEYQGKEYTVTAIGESAFENCTYTGQFKIPKTIKSIGPAAFMRAAFTGPLIINDEVETLGSSSLRYFKGITDKIYVGKSVHTIGVSCFDDGTSANVSEIIIMGKDLNIQNTTGSPFGYSNSTVKRIYLSEEVKGLSRRVFNEYTGVEEVICEGVVPPKNIYIEDQKGWSFWGGCCKKAVLKVPEESIDAYKKSIVWKDFVNIQAIEKNPTGISISQTECTLFAGETVSLSATVEPFYVRNKDIQWSVADNKIATVDADGTVKAISVGTTTVNATGVGGASASCVITVKEVPVSGINIDFIGSGIDGDNISMYAGDTKLIKVNVTPSNATDKTLTWESSSPSIVSVNSAGEVKALSVGEADITITAVSGVAATLHVIVLPTVASSITLNKTEATLKATETLQLEATVSPETTTDKTVTWTTSDAGIATVDENGVVTAVSVGKATVTATTANGLKATCEITVAETPASGIVIDKDALGITGDNLEMRVGEVKTINVTVKPETTTDKSVIFASSDPSVASVDSDGKVTAVALGQTTISITAKSGVTAQITVKVVATPAASITLNKTEATLKATETLQLEATVSPETTTDKTVMWTTSDAGIATVDENGVVTAVAVGKATVIATTANGLQASCEITVAETPASGIVIDKESLGITGDNLEMRVGEVKTINVTVEPATATDKTVTFASSHPEIATVDADGKVAALALGQTTISITAKSGVSTSITVNVVATPAASIILNKTEATLKATETLQLEATVSPETTTDKTVTWTTSDAGIATVDENGVVTAVSVGKATITAATANGLKASCEITVAETPASGIVIDKESLGITGDNLEMRVGEVKTINVTVEPATATDKTVTFASSHPEIATVDVEGKVTALSLGETTITITAKSGVTAQIAVKVVATPVESITLSETETSLKPKETLQLEATVMPETTTDKTIIWSSSDEEVATVSDNGLVTAFTVGEADIIATTADGTGLSAICKVTVEPILVESLSISPESFSGDEDDSFIIETIIKPDDATNQDLTFMSTNEAVAKVDANGKVTIGEGGSAIIRVETTDGSNLMQECVITSYTGIGFIFEDGTCSYDICRPDGTLLQKNADKEYIRGLPSGVYIIRQGSKTRKLLLTSN